MGSRVKRFGHAGPTTSATAVTTDARRGQPLATTPTHTQPDDRHAVNPVPPHRSLFAHPSSSARGIAIVPLSSEPDDRCARSLQAPRHHCRQHLKVGLQDLWIATGGSGHEDTASLFSLFEQRSVFLGLRFRGEGLPAYRFLGGRSPVSCVEFNDESHTEDRRYIYSFEGDFNDICSKADSELIPAGFDCRTFVIESLSGYKFPRRSYRLKKRFLNESVKINISNDIAYIEKKDTIDPKDGWIVVEIMYWSGWLRPF